MFNKRYVALCLLVVVALLLVGCAPGNYRWDQEISPGHKAGFWAGLWHGLIIIITFIVSLFTDEVGLYEISNTGWPYNLGFIVGLLFSLGGGFRIVTKKRKVRRHDWDEAAERIEERVKRGIETWLDKTRKEEKEKEWEEIAEKIEEKIKKILKEWAEKS